MGSRQGSGDRRSGRGVQSAESFCVGGGARQDLANNFVIAVCVSYAAVLAAVVVVD